MTLAKITPCFENGKGALMRGLHGGVGFGTTELVVVRPKGGQVSAEYLSYVFRSSQFKDRGEAEMYGAGGQKRVPDDYVRDFRLAVPPPAEQSAISAFVGSEARKTDALIAEQERLIELLKEKRQAVISHAVTKGLNPDAPMKPSGVDGCGSVPAHWAVAPLKRVASIRTGVAKGKDHEGRDTIKVPYLRVANVQDGYLDLSDVATIEIPEADLARHALRPGDVLMNEGGDFDKLGRGCVWNGQISPCITQNHVFAVRPIGVSSRWLNVITGSDYAQFYFMTRSKQSTNLASISSTNLMDLPVVLPPSDEQDAILELVTTEMTRCDELMAEAQSAITLLHERRVALISAAVTGQIDVRSFAEVHSA